MPPDAFCPTSEASDTYQFYIVVLSGETSNSRLVLEFLC